MSDPRAQSPRVDLDDVREALRDRIESLGEALFGQHSAAISSRTTRRWGGKGSLAVVINGPKRGAWRSHESGEGGGPIELISYARRCGFAEAVAWGAHWAGVAPANDIDRAQHRARDEQRRRDREHRQAQREAEEAADQRDRIARVQRLLRRTVPIDGTIAQTYLQNTRHILRPAAGWPDCLRFLPDRTVTLREEGPCSDELRRVLDTAGALVMVATLPDGTATACQRVYLTPDAGNLCRDDGSKIKLTLGVLDGAAARLPGPDDGPLLLAEGPETGLIAWAATGHATHVALGSMANHRPAPGRRVVLCRDDDRPHSPADKALMRALACWRKAGIDVRVAMPWPERRGDKSDFNDVIRQFGPAAVRDRIAAALRPGPTPPPRLPTEEGRRLVNEAVYGFFRDAQEWGERHDPANLSSSEELPRDNEDHYSRASGYGPAVAASHLDGPPVQLVQVDMGGGKSEAARSAVAHFLAELRRNGDERTVAMAVPTHALSAEQAKRFEALSAVREAGLRCRIWRGRNADDPNAPGRTMCRNLDCVREVQALVLDVDQWVCAICPHRETCAYLGQRKERADLWIVPHTMIFGRKPRALGRLAALIVDENPLPTALDGIERSITLLLESLTRVDRIEGNGGALATDRLMFLRRLALRTFEELPDGPLPRDAFLRAGFLLLSAQEARSLEWQTLIDVELTADMAPTERRKALLVAARNADLRRRAMVWTAIHSMMAPGGPERSGWATIGTENTDEGQPQRFLTLKGRREVAKQWCVPTLLLDATARLELVRNVWPTACATADVKLQAPYQRIVQTGDSAFALSRIDVDGAYNDAERKHRQRNLRGVHAIICREARRYAPGRVLIVAQARIEEALREMGNLPRNVELGHHNGVRGRDEWGPSGIDSGVRSLVVIGRTLPSSMAIAQMAEAMTGIAMSTQQYVRTTAWRELADGTTEACEAVSYPDPIGEALRWQACEAEVVQIIGRARGVNRRADSPVDVLVLTDVPLPLPVELIHVATLDPSPADLMLARGGVVLRNVADAAAAYPELWTNREAAKKAAQRERARQQMGTNLYKNYPLIRESPHLKRIEYRKAGPRFSWAVAWYDPHLVGQDITSWMTERLGPLA